MLLNFKEKKILLIVAHPDDEILGLGASMHKLIHEQGAKVRVIILGEGITSRADARNPEKWQKELEIHRQNIEQARQIIGYESVGIYDFADNRFDSVNLLDLIKVVEKEKQSFQPEIIFTHHGSDLNIDHRRTFEAVMTATRPMAHEPVKTIICFETASSTEWQAFNYPNPFLPNLFINFTEKNLQAKVKAMACYEFESRAYPHPRSSKALEIQAKRWGVATGKKLVEAFMLIRHIND